MKTLFLAFWLIPISLGWGETTPPVPDDVKAFLKRKLSGYELVTENDYRADVLQLAKKENKDPMSLFSIDFNGDGRADYVVFVVNRKIKTMMILVLLRRDHGFKGLIISKTSWKGTVARPVCRVVELKKDGEKGLTHRTYFAEGKPEAERQKMIQEYMSKFVIEVTVPNYGKPETCGADADADFYCSEGFYWDKKAFKSIKVCD